MSRNRRPFCPVCGKRADSYFGLAFHIQDHIKDPMYSCWCGFGTTHCKKMAEHLAAIDNEPGKDKLQEHALLAALTGGLER